MAGGGGLSRDTQGENTLMGSRGKFSWGRQRLNEEAEEVMKCQESGKKQNHDKRKVSNLAESTNSDKLKNPGNERKSRRNVWTVSCLTKKKQISLAMLENGKGGDSTREKEGFTHHYSKRKGKTSCSGNTKTKKK